MCRIGRSQIIMATNKKTSRQPRSKSTKSSGATASKRSNTATDSRAGSKAKPRGGSGKEKQRPQDKAQSRYSQQPRRQQSSSGGGENAGQGRIRRAASTAVGSVKDHPLTAAAIGAGVAA